MSLLSRFFRPKWQHRDPEVRRKAIAKVDQEETLVEILERESNRELRSLCLTRIEDVPTLEALAQDPRADVRDGARERRLALLLPGGPGELSGIESPETLITIAALTTDDQLRLDAIARIRDEGARTRLALEHPSANVRWAAAAEIEDLEALGKIAESAQGKDKRLYRLCKDRLARHEAAERAERKRQDSIAAWIKNAVAAAESGPDARPTPERWRALDAEWTALRGHAEPAQRDAAEAVLETLAALARETQHEREETAAHERARERAQAERNAVIEALRAGLGEPLTVDEMVSRWRTLNARWRATLETEWPSHACVESFEGLRDDWWHRREAVERVELATDAIAAALEAANAAADDDIEALNAHSREMKALTGRLAWPPEAYPEKEITLLREAIRRCDEARAALFANAPRNAEALEAKLDAMRDAIASGQTKQAGRAQREAVQLMRRLERSRATESQRRLGQLAKQLHEAADWESFAVTPKREALCARMEALIGADVPPDHLSEQIHALQVEWRALKGGEGRHGRTLWRRFKAAGDKAYEPCRVHFSAQAEQRVANLAARAAISEQLERYEAELDWEGADWALVRQTLEAARAGFRAASPVETSAHRASKKRFDAIADRIYEHLKGEYDRNVAAKERLLEQAESLAGTIENGDGEAHEALERLKELQRQWKAVGPVPNRADQRLWKAFRSTCDRAFGARDRQRSKREAELNERLGGLDEQIDAIGQALDKLPIAEARARLAACRDQVEDAELPPRARVRFGRALGDLEQRLAERMETLRREEGAAQWHALDVALRACRLRAGGDPVPAPPPLEEGSLYPPGVDLEALRGRWAQPVAATGEPERDELRRLCIELELVLDAASPEEDREARMRVQLERLSVSMGRAVEAEGDPRIALLNRWLRAPLDPELDERFAQVLAGAGGAKS